jgi:hypothetical protein
MAKDRPPMPFSTRDWLSCAEVKFLPPDIRGLLFDLICYMWESVECGVMVKPNCQPYTKDEITAMIGKDCSGSNGWLEVLLRSGVCSIRDDGAIYSRRMVKKGEIREKRRIAGKKGGYVTRTKVFSKPYPEPDSPGDDAYTPPLTPEQQKRADKAKKYKYAEFVSLTRDEYAKLCEEYSEEAAKAMIDILNNYKGSKGKKYKSDYLTIRGWVKDKYYEDLQKNGTERKPINGGAGFTNNQGVQGGSIFDHRESSEGDTETSKDYSKRF